MKSRSKSKSRKTWRFVLLALVAAMLFGVFYKDDDGLTILDHTRDVTTENDWVGWIHPLGDEIGTVVKTGPFNSLSECENYSWKQVNEEYERWDEAKYYCGYSCTVTEHRQRDQACKLVK